MLRIKLLLFPRALLASRVAKLQCFVKKAEQIANDPAVEVNKVRFLVYALCKKARYWQDSSGLADLPYGIRNNWDRLPQGIKVVQRLVKFILEHEEEIAWHLIKSNL